MDKTNIILSVIAMASWLFVVGPRILARNRGKVLQNIALWLAIILTLIVVYKVFGPGGEHPLFGSHR